MSNVIDFKPKPDTYKPVKSKHDKMDYLDRWFLNDCIYYLDELLMRRGKYSLKDLKDEKHWNSKSPHEFSIRNMNSKEFWTFKFLGWETENLVGVKVMNNEDNEDDVLCFPYNKLKNSLKRKKIATWIVSEIFKPIMGEEEVDSFMRKECVYSREYSFIDYD